MGSWQKKKLVQNLHKLLTMEKPINIIQDKNYQSDFDRLMAETAETKYPNWSHLPECVDERCSTENSARKCGVFTYLLAFSLKKVRKTGFIKKSVFLRNRRHFRDAAGRFYELVWLERQGFKKEQTDRPPISPSRGAGRWPFFVSNGAYVASASLVCHSLVVLVIAFS